MMKSLQPKICSLLFYILLSLSIPWAGNAQLLGWNSSNNGGGFGVSPWAPETIDSHLQCSGLTRGSAIGTSGGAAQSAWGGAGGWTGTPTDVGSFYFTFQATAGYKVSLSSISTATRRSNAGPSGCSVWYSINNAPPTKITDWITTSSSGNTGTPNSADLSGINDLQEVATGSTIKIYIVPQGSSTGNYYLNNGTNCLRIEGVVAPLISPLITPSLTSLNNFGDVIVGATSASQSFTFDGEGLTDDVSIAASAGFEISTDNTNWFPGSDFSPVGGSLNDMQIWVRFKPVATGAVSGNITLTSPGADDKIVAVSGTGLPVPALSVTPEVINSLTYPENGGPSAAFQLTSLTSIALSPASGTIIFSISGGSSSNYEISADGINWGFSAAFAYASADNTIVNPEIYVRMKAGLTAGAIAPDTVSVDGGGLSTFFTIAGIVDPPSTILSDDEPYGPFCNGVANTFDVDFTPSGSFTGTLFYAQISDVDGNFSNLPENIVGTSATSPITVTLPAGFTAGTQYRVRVFNDNPLTFSSNDNGHDIIINNITPFSGIVQQQAVCDGNEAIITLSGVSPDAVFNITYNINSAPDEVLTGQISDGSGELNFNVLLNAQNNGQTLTVTAIERSDITPSCGITLTANNTLTLAVNPLPQISGVITTPVCGSGEMTTVTVTGMLPSTTSAIDYTIAGGSLQTVNGVTADATGTATFQLSLLADDDGEEFRVESITRTDVLPSCTYEVNGISTLLIANERPTATIVGDQSICFGTESSDISISLTGTAPWNITYTDGTSAFTEDNIMQSPYTFTASIFSTKTYTVTAVEDAHCQALPAGLTGSATVTVNSFSNGGTVSGSATVCNGENSGTLELTGYNGSIIGWQSSENISFATFADIDNTTSSLAYADLTATTYYRAVVANGNCPVTYSTVAAITVNTVPSLITQSQVFCNEAHVADLFPSGAGIQWYADGVGGNVLADSEALATGDYYVSQTINGCESARTLTSVTVNMIDAPVTAAQSFCNQAIVSDLEPSGAGIQWYTSLSGGNVLSDSEALATGDYYVSQTINGCESGRTLASITINSTDAPEGETEQEFTEGETLADIDVSGMDLQWYLTESDLEEDLPADVNTPLVNGATYYVTQAVNGCRGAALAVTVTAELSVGDFDSHEFVFYPNPVQDILHIAYTETITLAIIYNINGQELKSVKGNESLLDIDVSQLPEGIYFMKVQSGDVLSVLRFVKK
ncbi:T9SS type A sorting domain-containing protein [Flavobacterium sp. BFFFF1]|uniref:T9SS type A sorting domain-containing protein n=1 Tax=Flavobacterium sp. BFFFF1 TaxID=2015557 RepID=UPI0025C6F8EC|nr:T9SS type A sorting domain-containing protein [Flavobacterium sp. BFFFF1]